MRKVIPLLISLAICGMALYVIIPKPPTTDLTTPLNVYAQAKSNVLAASDISQHAERRVVSAANRLRKQLVAADSQRTSSQSVLADTAATASQLREELSAQLRVNDSLTASVRVLLYSVDSLSISIANERSATARALARADSAIAAHREALNASQSGCRVLGLVRCPTRTQALLGGIALGFLLTR